MTITMLVAAQAHHREMIPVAISQARTVTAARLRTPKITMRRLLDSSNGQQTGDGSGADDCAPVD